MRIIGDNKIGLTIVYLVFFTLFYFFCFFSFFSFFLDPLEPSVFLLYLYKESKNKN